MKTKLFIDFDSTLFDTEILREKTFETLAKIGYSYSEIEETYKLAASDFRYTNEKQIRLLAERNQEVDSVEAKYLLDQLLLQFPKLVYNDAIEFLQKVDRDVFEVNLMSLGDHDFQLLKITSAGVEKYFDNVYVADEQKWIYLSKLVGPFEYFILIDDRGDTVNNVAKSYPNALAIELNRIDLSTDIMEPALEYNNVRISNFFELDSIITQHREKSLKAGTIAAQA